MSRPMFAEDGNTAGRGLPPKPPQCSSCADDYIETDADLECEECGSLLCWTCAGHSDPCRSCAQAEADRLEARYVDHCELMGDFMREEGIR